MMGGAKGIGRGILDHLTANEARDVLRRLLAGRLDATRDAKRIARALLGEVTFETIACEVEEAVCAAGLDDLAGRAGRHAWGYVEPNEAAWEILEEKVEPFVTDIKRRKALDLEREALEICKGVVLGLYRVERGNGSELVRYAPDFLAEAAGDAIDAWRHRPRKKVASRAGSPRRRPAFPQEFVDRFAPEWRAMIDR